MDPRQKRPPSSPPLRSARDAAKWIRLALLALGVLLLAGLGWAIFSALQEESRAEGWDHLARIRRNYEPPVDLQWYDPDGRVNAQRERYHQALREFLQEYGPQMKGPLEPQVRWRLANSLMDWVLSASNVLDATVRREAYDDAIEQLEIIRDSFPDYPLNWTRFQVHDPHAPTLTRQLIRFLEENRRWEADHLPQATLPLGDHLVVIRTTEGDLHLRLFEQDAGTWSSAFLQRARAGGYDGTSLYAREERETQGYEAHYVWGGGSHSRGVAPNDAQAALQLGSEDAGGGLLPDPSRYRTWHVRGTVSAWHDRLTEYDDADDFLVAVDRSPHLDGGYTPVGRIEGESSLAALDRISARPTWSDDVLAREKIGDSFHEISQVMQEPARIVKVLVFKDGTLLAPAGKVDPGRTPLNEAEQSLATLKADAYRTSKAPATEPAGDNAAEATQAPGDAPPLPPHGANANSGR